LEAETRRQGRKEGEEKWHLGRTNIITSRNCRYTHTDLEANLAEAEDAEEKPKMTIDLLVIMPSLLFLSENP
jgi:hypothetical protein